MTITPTIRIVDQKLTVEDRIILTGVPDNVIATSGSSSGPVEGIFIGAKLDQPNSTHIVSLGTLRDVWFMALFRFKLWWMAQKMGDKGGDIPMETQFLLVETTSGSHIELDGGDESNQIIFAVFLPLIEGSFRHGGSMYTIVGACLQGNSQDEPELCLESGDAEIKASSFSHSLFAGAGTHLKTFRQLHEKKFPGIIDCFGWCTWDAFYKEVTQEGVEAGLVGLSTSRTPPRFVVIDDGWQSVGVDPRNEASFQDEQPLLRLIGIRENEKFRKKGDPSVGI